MADRTGIEWTDATWNPVTGCTKVSPGCDHCYAETIAHRFDATKAYPNGFDVTLRPERLDQPLRWTKPRRVFVNSMSDLFHEDIPDAYIAEVWAVMALAQKHTFQILTKRHGRMRSLMRSPDFWTVVGEKMSHRLGAYTQVNDMARNGSNLPNVWLGVSVEHQQWADIRIPALLDTPAAVRFLSCEPLLGPVRLDQKWLVPDAIVCGKADDWNGEDSAALSHVLRAATRKFARENESDAPTFIDWVIVGGESGKGARPMHPAWARGLRDQCVAAGVPFHFKQRGEWTWNEPGQFRIPTKPLSDRVAVMHGAGMTALTKDNPFDPFAAGHPYWSTRIERVGKKFAGRELDGRTWDEFPEVAS